MEQNLTINAKPAVIEFDFDKLKAEITEHVKQYDVVVTSDTVKDAKKVAADLNKQANELDRMRKDKIAEVSAPIKEADGRLKELVGLYKDGYVRITDQVKVFDDETRKEAHRLLELQRDACWEELAVEPEFRRAEFEDLVKLTALTAKGNLSAAAGNAINERCRDDLMLQQRTEKRLLELENRSYKAGLKEPLTRDHVEHFLFHENDQYESSLDRILQAETQRQERIEAAERERQEREAERAKQKAEAEKEIEARRQAEENEQARAGGEESAHPDPAPTKVDRAPEPTPEPPAPAPAGKVAWNVTCQFRVECGSHIPQEAIENELRRVLEKAGVTTLESVRAVQQAGERAA